MPMTTASSGRVVLHGVAELKAALAEVGTAVATKLGKQADRDAANLMAAAMKETAPYSNDTPGKASDKPHLRDEIKVRLRPSYSPTTIVYRITTGKAFWGAFLEFGTVKYAAHPWMRSAFDSTVHAAIDLQIAVLREGIEAVAKRAARLAR